MANAKNENCILVTKPSMPTLEEYIAEIAPLWESKWLTNMGEKHKALEVALKKELEVDNLALFTNGHNALECILEALDLRGEVVTTPFSFASTTHAISRKGLTPVFADVRRSDLTLDPLAIEEMITPRTCAILAVHVYGNACDVDAIERIANTHGLKVIYDAAHAFGVTYNGRTIGNYGDASMFSFHSTKVFNTIEGGCVCFRDSSLYEVLNYWKNFGITGPEDVDYVGGNAKLNEFSAAMGLCNLRHFHDEIAKRKAIAERYWELLSSMAGIESLRPQDGVVWNYAYMPVIIDPELFGATRDDVFETLAGGGVGARKYFYPLISDYACYRSVYSSERTPVAKAAANSVLTLPMYADLTLSKVDHICQIIRSCSRSA